MLRFAIMLTVIGLPVSAQVDCALSGCFGRYEAQERLSVKISNIVFRREVIGQEVYASYDLPLRYGPVQPILGASITDTTDVWVGAGAKLTTESIWSGPIFAEFSLSPGIYVQGDGPDLGALLEFRSALGLGYRFDQGTSVTLLVDHRSNADIVELNPGLDTFGIRFSLPLN